MERMAGTVERRRQINKGFIKREGKLGRSWKEGVKAKGKKRSEGREKEESGAVWKLIDF
jgi:hypothetical protein